MEQNTFENPSMAHSDEDSNQNSCDLNCPKCGKEFKQKFNLTRHLQTCEGNPKKICPNCGEVFTRNLNRHINSCKG